MMSGRDGGGGEEGEEMERARRKEAGRERPGESEVTVFITAPDPLHRSGLSRAGPFNWEVNLRNQAGDENDKKKAFWYPATAEPLDISDDI